MPGEVLRKGALVRVINPNAVEYVATGVIVNHYPGVATPWYVEFDDGHHRSFASWELMERDLQHEWGDRPGTHDPF